MSTYFPSAADLADDLLSTGPHSKLHGDLGDTLSDYIAALGKVDPSGYGGDAILIDPANTDITDGGIFLQLGYAAAEGNTFTWGGIGIEALPGTVAPLLQVRGESADGNHYTFARFTATAPKNDGTGGGAGFLLNSSDFAGLISFTYGAGLSQVEIQANVGQTDPVLLLEDPSGADIFSVTGDKKIGFYAAPPVAQQTGVAVSDAAIHAALVNLGLITA